jgi:hypothetical protein
LLHQYQFQASAWSSNQAERKSKERIRDLIPVPLVQHDEAIEDIQMEAVHMLDEIRDDLAQGEEEEETEVLDFAVAAFHPSPYSKAPKDLHELNLIPIPGEDAKFLTERHMAPDRPYWDYKSQIRFFVDTLWGNNPTLGFGTIAKVFRISGGALSSLYKRQATGRCRSGRPSVLSEEQLYHLRVFIERHFEEGQPATFVGIANEIFDRFAINMIPDTLRKIVKRLGWCKILPEK